MKKKIKKVGLALGGGGARGCAHIGVIKALEEAGIPIHYVAGTSIGSFMGGVYAAGDIKKLEQILLKTGWKDVVKHFDPVLPKKGFFEGKKVIQFLKNFLPKTSFKYTRIPFIAVATDLKTGTEVHLKKGNMLQAIRASIGIPGILTPTKIHQQYLVDGGVINPLPVDVVQKMGADIVIAVDLNHSFIKEKRLAKTTSSRKKIPLYGKIANFLTPTYPNIIDVIEGSVFTMQDQLTQKNLEIVKPEFLIRPDLRSASIFDFHKAKKMIDEGYRKTKKIIPKLKKLL